MKAIILGAGRGTRVRPLTTAVPKPMLPILGRPVMESLIELLGRHGFDRIVVNTSYLAPEIEDYFRDGRRYGVQIAYSFEGRMEDGKLLDAPVGSAGAIRKIHDHSGFFDETFVVLCGDALIDIDLTALVARHREMGGIATIALMEVAREAVSNYGVVVTDDTGRIEAFQEKPPVEQARSNTVNTGIYVFEPEILDLIPSGSPFDIGGQLFPAIVEKGLGFYGASLPFQWLDIGRLADYYQVTQMALRGEVNDLPLPGDEIASGIRVGLNVRMDPDRCTLVPPVYVAGSATVEDGATVIGPSMIGPGAYVARGAHVERSLVFDYTRIQPGATVKDLMICGSYCVRADGTVVDLARTDVDWLVRDAREEAPALTADQQQLIELLREFNPDVT